ncbi:MAG: transcriptional regulator [Microcoleus sp. SU_5_3]|nr:transcriptional regulator [Microcoleus sp. SU_5_3]
MKTPILLKFLQKSAAKASPNFNNIKSRKGDAGFTLLELVVIVVLLGTLASIAAPGWLGFINRQRVRTVNDRVFQSLRAAQSEAKRSKRDIIVRFDTSAQPPTATIEIKTDTPPPTPVTPLQTLTFNGGGEIKPGQVALTTNAPATYGSTNVTANSIVFNYQGNVSELPPDPDPANPNNPGKFAVTVSPVGGGTKQCVIVDTLIGGMRTGEGDDCK